MSQDHLELFFGAIRLRGSCNNNPSARQFEAAYKRLLVHCQVRAGDSGNVKNLDASSILYCGSGAITYNENNDDQLQSQEYLTLEQEIMNDIGKYDSPHSCVWHLTDYVEDVVTYMAGFVARSMQKCVTCSFCYQLLEEEVESKLQERKQYKKLISASPVLIKICKTAEKCFCSFSAATNIFNPKIKDLNTVLVNNTMRHLQNFVLDSFGNHLYDHEFIDNHAIIFIKLAMKIYFKTRVHYKTKNKMNKIKISYT